MVIIMKVYFVFDIKNTFCSLYKGNERVLFNILKGIYYLDYDEVSLGKNLLNQLVNNINKFDLDKYLFVKYHQDIPYSKRGNTHYLNNLYKDEVSRLTVRGFYIKIEVEQKNSSFFEILNDYNKNYFVCEFKRQDYFFLNDKVKNVINNK